MWIPLYLTFVSDKFYKDCMLFWPLESVENIENVISHTWGQAKGGVQNAIGLQTDGVSGEIQLLDHPGESCDTQFLNPVGECSASFTVALWLKYWNRADGQRQVLFKTFGKFVVYHERNDSMIVRIERETKFCLKEIEMPEKIWWYLVFTFDKVFKILTVYRNGNKLNEFIRDEGCDNPGAPQFGSSTFSLGAGFGVFAQAKFSEVAIWKQVLSDETIADLSNHHTSKFTCRVTITVSPLLTLGRTRGMSAIRSSLPLHICNFFHV